MKGWTNLREWEDREEHLSTGVEVGCTGFTWDQTWLDIQLVLDTVERLGAHGGVRMIHVEWEFGGQMMGSLNAVYLPPLVTNGTYLGSGGWNYEGSLWP